MLFYAVLCYFMLFYAILCFPRFHAVECVPTPATLDCIWRATSVSPKTIHKYFGRSALPPSQVLRQ